MEQQVLLINTEKLESSKNILPLGLE